MEYKGYIIMLSLTLNHFKSHSKNNDFDKEDSV